MLDWIADQLAQLGLQGGQQRLIATLTLAAVVAALAWGVDVVVKRVLVRAARFLVSRSRASWDDMLVAQRVFSRLAQFAPALVIYLFAPAFDGARGWIERLALVYMIAIALRTLDALLDSAVALYQRTEVAREKPITGYAQVAKIFYWVIGAIFIVSMLLQREPWGLLTGLGAVSAVLLLVFRDSILGLVAGIQISLNDLVRRGDWIEIPSAGADGDVIDISLHTVKVQNWDKTISSVPVHHLVTQSFKNWRGMSESGGRRIKRAVLIDVDSIRFCNEEMLSRFAKIQYLSEYIDQKSKELAEWNEAHSVDPSQPVNGRRLTNVGTFRAYLEAYLHHHPKIHQDMTFLVRQLSPTREGLPIEIYVFSNDQNWARYEAIQADIFDHILAAAPEFDLRIAQDASAHNLLQAAREIADGLRRNSP